MGLQRRNILNMGNGSSPYYSGGYVNEDTGPGSQETPWTDAPMSGSNSTTYWYADSDTGDNNNALRVYVDVAESWNAHRNADNSIDITYTCTITKIEKRNQTGNPGNTPRMIKIAEYPGGPWIADYGNTPMQSGWQPPYLPPSFTRTLHLEPQSAVDGISTIYFKSGYYTHFDDPLPNIWVDAMGMGTSFRNTYYPVYRPGQRKINGTWESHNRPVGHCDRIGYGEMKSSNGGVGTDDPPSLKTSGTWYNQRKIGANG